MSDTPINYNQSPVPPAKPGGPASDPNPDRGISVVDGNLRYDSASASGHTEIILPALPGSSNSEERLLTRDFGSHVSAQIRRAFAKPGYLKSGPQQNAVQVFKHYCAVARGASLLDAGGLSRMQALAEEFSGEPDQVGYFEAVIRPWLRSLTPSRR